jgi:serine/threonine protein kinase
VERLGRYQILELLGRGTMGAVFRALDPKIDRVVAIKTITHPCVNIDEEREYRRRFFSEAHAAGQLSHPGLVTVYDVGEDESTQTPFIVMEYIEGQTLESHIRDSTGDSLTSELDLLKQIAVALDYAHSQGIVHRDIKPANIIITPQGRAKITDFGIAKLAGTQITLPGESPGTPSYMSPEQVSGEIVDGRSDLFSLGIILYGILTGEKPFTGESASAVTFKIAYKEPEPPSELNQSLDSRFDYVATRALAKSPANRYQSGQELADDLDDLCHDQPPRSQSEAPTAADMDGTTIGQTVDLRKIPSPAGKTATTGPESVDAARGVLEQSRRRASSKSLRWKVLGFLALFVTLIALISFRNFQLPKILPIPNASGISLASKTAKLDIHCLHKFRSANLLVWSNGRLICERKLIGSVKKRLVFIKKTQGSFSETLALEPGNHVIRVKVTSEQAGYNQTKEIEGEFPPETKKTLEISFSESTDNLRLTVY